jgi:hydrogenase-4 transcriptional activator
MFPALFVRPLSPEEAQSLHQVSRSANREDVCRAEVILLSSVGKTAHEISKTLGSHPANVKKWIRNFNRDGLEGIKAKKRGPQGGPKPKFTPEQISQILSLADKNPMDLGYPFREWTPQKLANVAAELGIVEKISHVTVRQLLKRKSARASAGGSSDRSDRHESPRSEIELGEAALAESRYEDAVRHFQSRLDGGLLSAEEEALTRSLLSKGLEELSKYDEAYRVLEKYNEQRAAVALSPGIRARVKLRLGWVSSFLRNHPRAIATLNEAKRLFLELQDDRGMTEVHYALGRTYIEINEFRIARDHLLAAVGFQKTSLDRDLLAQIYRRLGMVDFSEGAFSSSKEHYIKALELAEGSSNTNLTGGILLDLGTTLFHGFPGENQQSIGYIKRAITLLEKGGHKDYLALAYNNLGDNLKFSGEWDEAIVNLNRAIEVARLNSKLSYEATARITLAEILCARGLFAEAEAHLDKSLELIEGSGDKWLESNALRMLATVYRGAGRIEPALKTLRQTMQLSTSIGDLHGVTLAMVGLADFHLAQGGLDQAREYLELAQGRLKEETYLPASGLIQRLTGQLEAASGRYAEARQHIAQSISVFTTTDIPYDLARSYYEMGLLLKKSRDVKGSESNLRHALAILEKLGAEPDLELARRAINSIGQGEEESQSAKVSTPNDVLLMQRLIEASGSRELLEQELAAVVYENYPVEDVILCSIDDVGTIEVLSSQGINRRQAETLISGWDLSSGETVGRIGDRLIIKLGETLRPRIVLTVHAREGLDVSRLQPLIKQAELGLETCSLRAAARGAASRNVEQRIQTIMPGFVVGSAAMFDVIDRIYKIRTSDVTVLITGESGTGKELVARHIHSQSARGRAIFLPFNCTATPKEIIDSQLFGHRRGAFTGATTNYPGIIKAADGGTLFLDEIGDLSIEVQPKLMRFLQEGEIQPLGETKPGRVDVRILAATNADLERAVEEGRFREDLFHRLNIIRIHVPPLRDRREEIPVLAGHFLESCCSRSGKQGIALTQQAVDALINYDWPGNVRQLRNELERVVVYATEGARVTAADLSPEVLHPRRQPVTGGAPGPGGLSQAQKPGQLQEIAPSRGRGEPVKLRDATAALERELIQEALKRNRYNLSRTAADLGLSRRGLRLKLTQLGLARGEAVVPESVGIAS